jgi:hypothetical protein
MALKYDIHDTASTGVSYIRIHLRIIDTQEDSEPQSDVFNAKLQNYTASSEK